MLLVSVVMYFLFWPTALLILLVSLGVGYIFREPYRRIGKAKGMVISPVDGVVQTVQLERDEHFARGQCRAIRLKVRLGMVASLRSPVQGRLVEMKRDRTAPSSSGFRRSDSLTLWIRTAEGGQLVGLRMIPATRFSRVMCNVKIGDQFQQGQRIGSIPFGAHVIVLVNPDWRLKAEFGGRHTGGVSPLVP
ncbi:MAG: phosphatidylserine decarboxylase [Candidatus Sumerlaeia bacterium]|nr:phosphatidylserine decarboxylase [Candidatus Sumerlaeia bacterium]